MTFDPEDILQRAAELRDFAKRGGILPALTYFSETAQMLEEMVAGCEVERHDAIKQMARMTERFAELETKHADELADSASNLAIARQRIADLESACDAHSSTADEANERASAARLELERLTAILRAIYPVYRAAVAMSPDWNDPSGSFSRIDAMNEHCAAIDRSASAARAALTPDLIAALQAAGLEEP